jgi:flagellar motor switch protein FliN/FliY
MSADTTPQNPVEAAGAMPNTGALGGSESGAVTGSAAAGKNFGLVLDVEVEASLRFGQREMQLREILELHVGSVIELDRRLKEPVELVVAGRVIARGEVVIVDGNYGLRVVEVPSTDGAGERLEK